MKSGLGTSRNVKMPDRKSYIIIYTVRTRICQAGIFKNFSDTKSTHSHTLRIIYIYVLVSKRATEPTVHPSLNKGINSIMDKLKTVPPELGL